MTGLLEANSETIHNRQRLVELGQNSNPLANQETFNNLNRTDSYTCITKREIENAINTMKKGNAPGHDNITINIHNGALYILKCKTFYYKF